jgi:hypothetical protein
MDISSMAQASSRDVFISYSCKDNDVMWRIARFLREQGITVWVTNERLVTSMPIWEREIEKAIKAASTTIVLDKFILVWMFFACLSSSQ